MVSALSIRALTRRMHAGLSARFLAFQALTDVSLDVHPGELVAVIGPPGSGKTTLLRCAAGEISAITGSIAWFGVDARSGVVPPGIALVREQTPCRRGATLSDALRTHAAEHSLPSNVVERRIASALERSGLVPLSHSRSDRLSVPSRRRFSLALALMLRPKLLLVDTVLDALDARTRDDLLSALRAQADEGNAVLLSTREARVADRAHRRLALVDGRIVPRNERATPAPARCLELSVSHLAFASDRLRDAGFLTAERQGRVGVPIERHSPEEVLSFCHSRGIEVRASRIVVAGTTPSRASHGAPPNVGA